MRTHFHLLALVAAAFLFLSAAASGGRRSILAGKWDPIKNISDPHILEIAKFAVTEHNKVTNAKLTLLKVVSGDTQGVSGVNYRLVLAARGGAGVKNYEAVVWEKPWEKKNSMKLTSFKPTFRFLCCKV